MLRNQLKESSTTSLPRFSFLSANPVVDAIKSWLKCYCVQVGREEPLAE